MILDFSQDILSGAGSVFRIYTDTKLIFAGPLNPVPIVIGSLNLKSSIR